MIAIGELVMSFLLIRLTMNYNNENDIDAGEKNTNLFRMRRERSNSFGPIACVEWSKKIIDDGRGVQQAIKHELN